MSHLTDFTNSNCALEEIQSRPQAKLDTAGEKAGTSVDDMAKVAAIHVGLAEKEG